MQDLRFQPLGKETPPPGSVSTHCCPQHCFPSTACPPTPPRLQQPLSSCLSRGGICFPVFYFIFQPCTVLSGGQSRVHTPILQRGPRGPEGVSGQPIDASARTAAQGSGLPASVLCTSELVPRALGTGRARKGTSGKPRGLQRFCEEQLRFLSKLVLGSLAGSSGFVRSRLGRQGQAWAQLPWARPEPGWEAGLSCFVGWALLTGGGQAWPRLRGRNGGGGGRERAGWRDSHPTKPRGGGQAQE